MPKIAAAAPNAILVVGTDPPDPLADIARKAAGHGRVLSAGTYLDSQRFRIHLGNYFGADPAHVEAQVIGGSRHLSCVPVVFGTNRNCANPSLLQSRGEKLSNLRTEIEKQVRYANIAIIEGHEASQYGIGIVSARITEMIMNDEHAVIPIGSFQEQFGVTLSLPSIVGRDGIVEVLPPGLPAEEEDALAKSANTLKKALAALE